MTLDAVALLLVGLVLASAAGYFVGRLVAAEAAFSGTQLRVAVWAFDEDGQPRSALRGKVGDLLTCAGCFGSWAAIVAWSLFAWSVHLHAPRVVLALAAIAAAGVQLERQHATTNRVERTLLAGVERERLERRR